MKSIKEYLLTESVMSIDEQEREAVYNLINDIEVNKEVQKLLPSYKTYHQSLIKLRNALQYWVKPKIQQVKEAKAYDEKGFEFSVGDRTFIFKCHVTNTRNGFCHHVYATEEGNNLYTQTRVSYQNRTWEAYQYQTALIQVCDKMKREKKIDKATCDQLKE